VIPALREARFRNPYTTSRGRADPRASRRVASRRERRPRGIRASHAPLQSTPLPSRARISRGAYRNPVDRGSREATSRRGHVGSVGRAAVSAARARGGEVLARVRRQQKEEASKLNVELVALDDDAELDQLPRLDSIADTVGGEAIQKLLSKVKAGAPSAACSASRRAPKSVASRCVRTEQILTPGDSRRSLKPSLQATLSSPVVMP
jgi:hypothetical protein